MQLAGGATCAKFTAPGPVITPAIGGIRVPWGEASVLYWGGGREGLGSNNRANLKYRVEKIILQ